MQVQLLETLLLNLVNHQSLIATKARRITAAAEGRPVMEFGARRAQGPDASVYMARGQLSLADVPARRMFWQPSYSIFRLRAQWHTVGLNRSVTS